MAGQLDILALEPFYGGMRKAMLDTLLRYSRHRWTLLKLPPRRMERRLSTAAIWFAEQLSRHWVGRVDLLFSSEAMNLADLLRRTPALARKPAAVYFHANQLPDPWSNVETTYELVNLNTATIASQIWFNSIYHLRNFLSRASALVERHPELSARNPMADLVKKAQVVPPPVDCSPMQELLLNGAPPRHPRTIFIDTRDADVGLLNAVFGSLRQMEEQFSLLTVGPVEELDPHLPRHTISESDEPGQFRALCEAGLVVSGRIGATCDQHMIRGLVAGCWPIAPNMGVYPELLPESLHLACLYDGTPDSLLNRLLDAWNFERLGGYQQELEFILHQFDPATACRLIDDRLEEMA